VSDLGAQLLQGFGMQLSAQHVSFALPWQHFSGNSLLQWPDTKKVMLAPVLRRAGLCCAVLSQAEAVPKKILELMKVDGLTRENVASHLQKYRLYLKRVQQSGPQQGSNPGHASAAAAAAAAGAGSFAGMGLQGMVAPNQMMWGNSKQLVDAMQAQQQAAAATVQQAAGAQQMLQQPQQPGQQQLGQPAQMGADGGMGGLLGMMPGRGLMSPMGQMVPGMNMGMGAMAGGCSAARRWNPDLICGSW
jgi:hypothetical protein